MKTARIRKTNKEVRIKKMSKEGFLCLVIGQFDFETPAYVITEDMVELIRDACEVYLEEKSQENMKESIK